MEIQLQSFFWMTFTGQVCMHIEGISLKLTLLSMYIHRDRHPYSGKTKGYKDKKLDKVLAQVTQCETHVCEKNLHIQYLHREVNTGSLLGSPLQNVRSIKVQVVRLQHDEWGESQSFMFQTKSMGVIVIVCRIKVIVYMINDGKLYHLYWQ